MLHQLLQPASLDQSFESIWRAVIIPWGPLLWDCTMLSSGALQRTAGSMYKQLKTWVVSKNPVIIPLGKGWLMWSLNCKSVCCTRRYWMGEQSYSHIWTVWYYCLVSNRGSLLLLGTTQVHSIAEPRFSQHLPRDLSEAEPPVVQAHRSTACIVWWPGLAKFPATKEDAKVISATIVMTHN